MSKLIAAFTLCLIAQAAFAQPESLQLAEDSRTTAGDARDLAVDSREECERLEIGCQAWIVAVMAVNLAEGISFQSTLNVINKTRPTRSESEAAIEYAKGLQYLASAKIAWEMYQDEELCDELANKSITAYAESQGIFDSVAENNGEKIPLLKALLFNLQQYFGIGERQLA